MPSIRLLLHLRAVSRLVQATAIGPEDAALVLWEEAREWAAMEFKKQRPSIDPLMAYTLGEIEIPVLALERMEELREQYGR